MIESDTDASEDTSGGSGRGGSDSAIPGTRDVAKSPDTRDAVDGEDEGNAPLVHAELVKIAYYTEVDALKKITLYRLNLMLESYDQILSKALTLNFIALVEYCYTPPRLAELDELVSDFAASRLSSLVPRMDMYCLLSEGGDFPSDLIVRVADRLFREKKKVRGLQRKLREQKRLSEARALKEA